MEECSVDGVVFRFGSGDGDSRCWSRVRRSLCGVMVNLRVGVGSDLSVTVWNGIDM
jgi:hypothetical protein